MFFFVKLRKSKTTTSNIRISKYISLAAV